MTGFQEEIFGPVLGVQTFDDEDEGMALAQHPVYGLAGAVYTRDINKAIRAARSLQAGTVWVNTWGRKAADMTSPFGGYKQSGFGREAGRAGYQRFFAHQVHLDSFVRALRLMCLNVFAGVLLNEY